MAPRKKMRIHKAYSYKEAEDFDIRFWRRAGALMRFAATWSMVIDYLKWKGHRSGQPRLRRTLQIIKRP